jgi:hypothetical protein
LQLQFWISDDPAGEFMFWGQLISMPTTQYLPGLQGLQDDTLPTPYVPLRHRQKLTEGLCGGLACAEPWGHPAMCPPPRQKLLAGHCRHITDSFCTVVL